MPNENNSELWPQNPRQNFTTVTTWRGNSFIVYTPMALNLISTSISLHPSPSPPSPSPFLIPKHRLFKLCSSSSCFRTSAQSGGTEGRGVTQEDPPLPAALSGMYMHVSTVFFVQHVFDLLIFVEIDNLICMVVSQSGVGNLIDIELLDSVVSCHPEKFGSWVDRDMASI